MGLWESSATWGDTTLPVAMELRPGSVGEVVGTIEYALYGSDDPTCGGDVVLQSVAADGSQIALQGLITYDPAVCLVDATVGVTFDADGVFAYDWIHPVFTVTGTGTLTRTAGEPPKLDQGALHDSLALRGVVTSY